MTNTHVNYIWLSRDARKPETIPSSAFYWVQVNARLYPRTPFTIWVDDESVCDPYEIPPNVGLAQIDKITSFSQTPLFRETYHNLIWSKLDVARLMILRHVLEQKNTIAVYSDLDVPDIKINDHDFSKRIENYGMALGASFNPKTLETTIKFENGFLAFTCETRNVLEHILNGMRGYIENPDEFCNHIAGYRHAAYNLTRSALSFWSEDHHQSERKKPFPVDWQDRIGNFPVLPHWGTEVSGGQAVLRNGS